MKNKYILLVFFLILGFNNFLVYSYVDKTNPKEELSNFTFEFNSKVLLKDIIKKEKDGILDTSSLGNKVFEDDEYIINYNVVDTTKPLILGSNTKTVEVNKKTDLTNKFLCGDNYDDTPKCYIEGYYDINKIGTYNLTYVAIDSSGNKSTKDFKLKVVKPSSSTSTDTKPRIKISEFIKKYKTDKTRIGIDVSAWQDDIDWKKVKDSGVEFAIIRIGFGHTSKGEIKIDNWYLNNIKKAKEQNIDLGLYFYSYASSEKEAIEQADWTIKTFDGESLSLPIAFDWEDWSDFNSYKVSFKKLNNIASSFINEIEKHGYDGMLYGSAYYLNRIWEDYDKTWLAYYTDNNDYEKDYMIWQLSSRGEVPGIVGNVDINVLYK